MKKTARIIAALLCIMMAVSLCGCEETPVQKQVFAMDTIMTLTAYGKHAEAGLDSAEGVIASMDSMLDPEYEGSYTYLINHTENENAIVPPQVADMLSKALEVYKRSGGALDLSVYPIYEAWGGFDPEKGRIPSSEELSELMKMLNFGDTSVTAFTGEANYSVYVPANTQISFGAVAKGCASEYAIDAMRKAGVESGLVSLGGNVQTLGLKPDGTNWTVAVENPRNPGSYVGTVSVGETAVVTSGNYQRYFKADGQIYHHIIDPDTGMPADNNLLSVTVVCDDGTLADCLSTAMYVLGEKAAMNYWREYGDFDMIMVTSDGRVVCTSGLIEIFTLTDTDSYEVSFVE